MPTTIRSAQPADSPSDRPARWSWPRRHKILTGLAALVILAAVAPAATAAHADRTVGQSGAAVGPSDALLSCMNDPQVKSISVEVDVVSAVVASTAIGPVVGADLVQDDSDAISAQRVVQEFLACRTAAEGPNGLLTVDGPDGTVLTTVDY